MGKETKTKTKIFCLDTSVFINAWNYKYPIDVFPRLWEELETLGENGCLKSPEEVYNEIKAKDDKLTAWVKDRSDLFFEKETEEIQVLVTEILKKHPRLLDTKKGRSGADVWVIAFAEYYDGIVVSEELNRSKPGKSPKIPDVCDDLDVPHMDTITFIRAIELSF